MKINIVFPYNTWGGAFRSTFELCNRMAERGGDIVIYIPFFPYLEGESLFSRKGLCLFVRGLARSLIRRGNIPWFDLKVPLKIIPFINDLFIREADIIIANHWPTASSVHNLSTEKGCLLYTSPSPRDRQKSRMPSSA